MYDNRGRYIPFPFQRHWPADDAVWMKQRKANWQLVKKNLEHERVPKPGMTHVRKFYLEGTDAVESTGRRPKIAGLLPKHYLAFTPCETVEDILEILDWIGPKYAQEVYRFALSGGATSKHNPFGYAGGQEELIANAIYPADSSRSKALEILPAEELLYTFERIAYGFLTRADYAEFAPAQFCADFYFSLVREFETRGERPPQSHVLRHLLSVVFNFVEPRALTGETTRAQRFSEDLKARFEADDCPSSIRAEIDALGPTCIVEYAIGESPEKWPPFSHGFFGFGDEWSAPFVRVLHGVSAAEGAKAVIEGARALGFIAGALPPAELVDMAPWMSADFRALCDPDGGETLPAWRISLWFDGIDGLSESTDARLGVDLFLLTARLNDAANDQPSLIYAPRLSAHYEKFSPNEFVMLRDSQLRREVFARCGQHLLDYAPEEGPIQEYLFTDNPQTRPGFEVMRNSEIGSLRMALDGPTVAPLEARDLPELDMGVFGF